MRDGVPSADGARGCHSPWPPETLDVVEVSAK